MIGRLTRHDFVSRPGDAESWIAISDAAVRCPHGAADLTAGPTIAVTPATPGRIEVAVFRPAIWSPTRCAKTRPGSFRMSLESHHE